MKKAPAIAFILFTIIYFSSCKKCFTCTNECTECIRYDSVLVTLTDTVDHIIRTYDTTFIYKRDNIHCTDDQANPTYEDYLASVANDTTAHFACASHAPTYNFDFCVNKTGAETYPDYHDHLGRAPCVQK